MNHKNVLKKAWQVLWRYKALWLFGVLLALTSFSAWSLILSNNADDDVPYNGFQVSVIPNEGVVIRTPSLMSGDIPTGPIEDQIRIPGTNITIPTFVQHSNFEFGGVVSITRQDGLQFEFTGYREWLQLPANIRNTIITVLVVLAVIALVLLVVGRFFFYISSNALIRMVDEYEESGVRRNIWQGFRVGFSRSAWRFFLMDLLIDLPVAAVFAALFALATVPLFLWLTGNTLISTLGSLASISFFLLFVLAALITSVALSLVKHFFRRACAMEDLGVVASIQRGYAVVRQHVKDVGLMWLIVAAIYIFWPMMVLPVVMLLIGFGLAMGGSIALLAGGLVTLVSGSAALPWIIAALMGILTFILTLAVPLVFLEGLRAVYVSSAWTLTYRELRPMTTVLPETVPATPAPELPASESEAPVMA